MGVVYSSEELLTGAVPQEGAHLEAANRVIEQVGSLSIAHLTVVHGSVVNGNANRRSDLDVLITYDSSTLANEPTHVRIINDTLDEIGDKTNVKIEANIWPAHEPLDARAQRMYDLLFSRHLVRSMQEAKWTVGEPDQTILDVAEASYGDEAALKRVILQYTIYKHASFAKAPRTYAESDKVLAALQRAFEFPKSTGRKINQMLGIDRELSPEENWEALVGSELHGETRHALNMLTEFDAYYTQLVEELCRDDNLPLSYSDIDRYQEWLRGIYPRAIDLGIVAASGFTNFIAST